MQLTARVAAQLIFGLTAARDHIRVQVVNWNTLGFKQLPGQAVVVHDSGVVAKQICGTYNQSHELSKSGASIAHKSK